MRLNNTDYDWFDLLMLASAIGGVVMLLAYLFGRLPVPEY